MPEYFIYNGIKYGEGTVITINRKGYNEDVTFYYTANGLHVFRPYLYGQYFMYSPDKLAEIIVAVTDKTDKTFINWKMDHNRLCRKPQYSFAAELRIDALFIAWIWYIIIMLAAVILNNCIGIWCFTSYVFFSYRKKKLKEAGYK